MIKRRHIVALVLIIIFLAIGLALRTIPYNVQTDKQAKKPIIGIMLNVENDKAYSIYPYFAIRKNYSDVVIRHGGIPVFLGHDYTSIDDYLNMLDGIVLTGGDFETSEEAFTTGLKSIPDPKKFPRERMEVELIRKAYERNIPVIGMCAGMQEMNVAMGGTLHANLIENKVTTFQHRVSDRAHPQHAIKIDKNSKLYQIIQSENLHVNSNHNAGIKQASEALKVVARAPDGVIEAFEAPNKRFFIGVMWHPEFVLSEGEHALWQAFISAAKKGE